MYILRYEGGVMSDEQSAIESVMPKKMNSVVKAGESVGDTLIARWFGTKACPGNQRYNEFDTKRKAMTDYLNNKCQVITFVKKIYGGTVDGAKVEQGDYAQVMSNCFPKESTGIPGFVPSGLRLYLLGTGFIALDASEQFNTLAHEISHRVLDTTDYWYGKEKSISKAAINHANVLDCAENWGYFYQEVLEKGSF